VLSDASKRRLYDSARAAERRAARRGDAGTSAATGHWTEFRERSRGGFGFGGGFEETYGNFHESEMRRRERLARDAERRREEERVWWAHEKEEATRASARFRVNAARAEEKRAVRVRETTARNRPRERRPSSRPSLGRERRSPFGSSRGGFPLARRRAETPETAKTLTLRVICPSFIVPDARRIARRRRCVVSGRRNAG
jgi:hypothetical protein